MRKYAVLRYARIGAAAFVFGALTACFTGAAGARAAFGWTAKGQFLPALLSGGALAAAWVAVTLVCGRLYCSVVCPLGVAQDAALVVRRTVGRVFGRKGGAPARRKAGGRAVDAVRWCAAAAFFGGGFAGMTFAWLDPYGLYGRAASLLALRPAVETTVWPAAATVAWGVAPVAVILLLAAVGGRVWCNAVCPVGTLLGCAARVAALRPRIDAAKCVKCRQCEKACGARCIDIAGGCRIDGTRCVSCFACGAVCRKGAISWSK